MRASSSSRAAASAGARPVALSFYDLPPNIAVPLDRFERLAAERLQVMVSMEDARTRSLLSHEELRARLDALLKTTPHLQLPLSSSSSNNHADDVMDDTRKLDDLLSHWVLALVFCANEDSRKRFVNFEADLFRYRFAQLSPAQVSSFIEAEQVSYERVSEAEMRALAAESSKDKDDDDNDEASSSSSNPLEDVARAHQYGKPASSSSVYYKVAFTQVCDLVRQRRVFVRRGLAYLPQSDVVSALATVYRTRLQDKLMQANRTLSLTMQDERMGPLLVKLQNASVHSLGGDLALVKSGAVTLDALPMLAKRSFPMCARELEQALTTPTVHRFMNDSRQQYILFLKGIGLSMDDCMLYFQREFQRKNLSQEEFKKRGYGYTVQHNYGQVGKRASYAPWSCVKAISNSRQSGEHTHGCTFKELSPDRLAVMLRQSGVQDAANVRKVQDLAKAGSYQLACRLHWELLHPQGNAEPVGNHPNAWFDASVRYFEEKKPEAEGAASASASAASAAAATTSTPPT